MSLTCYLVLLLMCSMDGVNTAKPADYIPTDVKCGVINYIKPSQDTNNTVIMRVSWNIASSVISNVRRYVVECHCAISGHRIDHKVNCNPPCSHQIILNNASCYDKCHCHVRSIIRQSFVTKYMNWSNVSTCNIGPTATPKAPPVITSSPVRTDDQNSTEITFKLPAENLHCDSTKVIHGIRVNVTDAVTGSHQYSYDQPTLLHTNDSDERSYTFTFQVEQDHFWRPFIVTIAVNNSIGSSPYSDHMIAIGATNGDITRSDYELEFYWNPVESMIYFHWLLSKKAYNMMSSQFIIGFHVIIVMLQPDDHSNLTMHFMEGRNLFLNVTMENTNLTVTNITLKPNQRYLLIGRILTEDSDTWRPEDVYKYFETNVTGSPDNPPSDHNNSLLVILSCVTVLLTILVVALLLYIARLHTMLGRLCHDNHSDNINVDDNCTDKMDQVIGKVTESYTDYPCDTSYVENISSSDMYSRNQHENTSDVDSSITDDHHTQNFRITSV